jgi:hypothetical protein
MPDEFGISATKEHSLTSAMDQARSVVRTESRRGQAAGLKEQCKAHSSSTLRRWHERSRRSSNSV